MTAFFLALLLGGFPMLAGELAQSHAPLQNFDYAALGEKLGLIGFLAWMLVYFRGKADADGNALKELTREAYKALEAANENSAALARSQLEVASGLRELTSAVRSQK